MSATQSVAKKIPRAVDVRVIDFSRITGYPSQIRVGKNEQGLYLTPRTDVIGMCTGQTSEHCSRTYNNLPDSNKNELDEDLKDNTGNYTMILFCVFIIFTILFCVGTLHNQYKFPAADGKWYAGGVVTLHRGFFKILLMLTHPNAAQFRAQASDILCAAFSGDERLVQTIRITAQSDDPVAQVFRLAQAAGPAGPAVMPPAADLEYGVVKYQEMLQLQNDISSKKKEDDERAIQVLKEEAALLKEKKAVEEAIATKQLKVFKAQEAAELAKQATERAKQERIEATERAKKQTAIDIMNARQNLKRPREPSPKQCPSPQQPLPQQQQLEVIPFAVPLPPKIPSLMRFVSAILSRPDMRKVKARALYQLYLGWWRLYNANDYDKVLAANTFGSKIQLVDGIKCERESAGNVYFLHHERIKECLQTKNVYDASSSLLAV